MNNFKITSNKETFEIKNENEIELGLLNGFLRKTDLQQIELHEVYLVIPKVIEFNTKGNWSASKQIDNEYLKHLLRTFFKEQAERAEIFKTFEIKYKSELKFLSKVENNFSDICEYEEYIQDTLIDLTNFKEMLREELFTKVYQTELILNNMARVASMIERLYNEY